MTSGTRSAQGELSKAVIYLRVSSPGQVKKEYDREGLSLPAQRQACTKKAQGLDAVVVEEFVEPGVPAARSRSVERSEPCFASSPSAATSTT